MTAPTLAERISRRASSIVGGNKPQPEDPGALQKAEAALQVARDALAVAHKAHLAAVAEATGTGDGAKIRAARRELEACQAEHEVAASVWQACRDRHSASVAASDHEKRLAAMEKLQRQRNQVAVDLDAAIATMGELYAKRRQLDEALIDLTPDGRSVLATIRDGDNYFREQLGLRQIPGGMYVIRSPEYHRTCAVWARETGAAAVAALKGTPKAKPGA
jgi:hypothetical protein